MKKGNKKLKELNELNALKGEFEKWPKMEGWPKMEEWPEIKGWPKDEELDKLDSLRGIIFALNSSNFQLISGQTVDKVKNQSFLELLRES